MGITKFRFILIVSAFAMFNQSCKMSHKSGKTQAGLTESVWELVEMPGTDPENLSRIWLKFEEGDEKKTSGFAGCNRFFGSYEISGKQLEFGNISSTKMYCPLMDTETLFLEKLDETDNFKISDTDLILFSGKNKMLVFHATSMEEIEKRN